jgi:hypothetical protein
MECRTETPIAPPALGRGIEVLIKTPNFNVVGFIENIGTHALSFAIKQPLEEGTAVTIEFGAECRQGHIVSCRRNGSGYVACVVISNTDESDRRCAERFPITEEVRICADSLESQQGAVIVDLSVRGVGLEISAPLRTGEIVALESPSSEAFGVVRHCRELSASRYHVGVEIFHIMVKEPADEDSPKISVVSRVLPFH